MILKTMRIVALFLFVMLWSSCKEKNKNETDTKKDELVLAIGGLPDNGFDPTNGWGQLGNPLFQSKLFRYDKDLKLKNELATDYEVSDEGKKWTVDLRDDVKFSDGETLTAEDVVFTFETAKESKSIVDLTYLEKVSAADDNQVVFELKQPNSTFIYLLESLGIVPKHAYNNDYGENPIGSGPYELVKWDKGQQVIVRANPHYFGKEPFFKKITFLSLSEDAAFAAAKAGQVDMISVSPSISDKNVDGMSMVNLKTVDNRGVLMPVVPDEGETKDGRPIGNDVTSDKAIRKALNIGIDRQKIIDGVLNGYGNPAYTMVDDLPWGNPDAKFEDADLEEAKKILDDAGWKENDDGLREKDGTKAKFKVFYPASSHGETSQGLALSFVDMAKSMGIEVESKGVGFDELDKIYDNALIYGGGSRNPLDLYEAFSSETVATNTNHNNYYTNSTVDEYFEKALAAKSEEEANENWQKAQWDGETGFTYKGDAAWVWLVNFEHLYLIKDDLEIGAQKLQPHPHSWPVTDFIEDWHWKD